MSVENDDSLDVGIRKTASSRVDGVIRYDREELVSYFLAFASPEELLNHKQVHSLQPLPPDSIGERLSDVNSTAVLSYQRVRERDSMRRRKNRTSLRCDEESGQVEEDWWAPQPDRKSGLARKKSDSPKRNEIGSLATPTETTQPCMLFEGDDFTFDFEEEDDENTSATRWGFGKSLVPKSAGDIPPSPAYAPPPPPAFAPPPPPKGLQSRPQAFAPEPFHRSVSPVRSFHDIASLGSPVSPKRKDSLEAFAPQNPTSMGYALPSASQVPSDPDTDLRHRCWRYRDPQGVVQGPFSTLEMQHWNDLGYFSATLPLQHVDRMGSFLPLKTVFPQGVLPFRATPQIQAGEDQEGDKRAMQTLRQAPYPPDSPQNALHNIHQLHQHLASQQYPPSAAAARQKQAAQVHAAQQVAVAAHHAALHGNTHAAFSGNHDYGAKHRLEQQSVNIKNLLHMHQPADGKGLPAHQSTARAKQRERGSAPGTSDKKRERRKKDKDDVEEGRKEAPYTPPTKPMLQSTQEFPSLGASVSGVESSHSHASLPTKSEPEGFWERPPRPIGPTEIKEDKPKTPNASVSASSKETDPSLDKSAKVLPRPDPALDKSAKLLPRRKRGKGVAADPKMLGFVATHRGVSIDHGD